MTEIFTGSPRLAGERKSALTPQALWQDLLSQHSPVDAAAAMEGDFAVATARPDGSVFLAVDRFAIRSLCYRIDGGVLRIAERADALAGEAGQLSDQAVFEYLYHHIVPSPHTVFAGVQRLPPGHCAEFRDGKLHITRYWTPRFTPRTPDVADAKKQLRALLRDAVAKQMDGSKPACFLSGGVDSSTVAGMMAELASDVSAYSIGFEANGYDEMEYARVTAKRFGLKHREIYFTPDILVADIPKVAASYDQPFGNSSVLPSFHCAREARGDGVSRILAGDGGDELFGGNSRYATQQLFDHWQRLPGPLRDGLLGPLFRLPIMAKLPVARKAASYVRQASQPMPGRIQEYNLIKRIGYQQIFPQPFLDHVSQGEIESAQNAVWAQAEAPDELDRHLAYDWRYTLAECDLPKVVGSTQLAGVSVGFPMLDEALVQFSMQLPPAFKVNGQELRWFFKDAMRGFLPDEVITKKKQGFGLPFGVWMVEHAALNALTRDALRALVPRGLIREEFVRQFFEELLPTHPHYYGSMAWILLMLEHWLRAHAPDWSAAK
ncbi:asparagine synthetase B family protein [Roseateles sp.]|uniref:asparagine synthetase B family protein n=1 Tax=Roseateles sp. TaxID=1971397 RepID=UPI003964821C